MPPAPGARLSFRSSSSTITAADARCTRGWLSVLRRETRRAEDDGIPLNDDLLLRAFARIPELADLVRCVAACPRWRRLVSGDAAFICRTPRRPPGRYVPPLAFGFFHHQDRDKDGDAAAPRFVPTASAAHLLGLREPPSLNSLAEGLRSDGGDGLFHSSRVVASRNGLVVVELRRGESDTALKLCICNPMTGELHVLPPLSGGNDGVGPYACTVVTADELDTASFAAPPRSPYHLLMVCTRGRITRFRRYSPADGGWSQETEVSGIHLPEQEVREARTSVVTSGGKVAYWMPKNVLFRLRLDTLQAGRALLPWTETCPTFEVENTLLGASPEGRLIVVQIDRQVLSTAKRRVSMSVYTCSDGGGDDGDDRLWTRGWWERQQSMELHQYLPADATKVKLRWFCEKSGVVFFTVSAGAGDRRRSQVYAVSLGTREVEKVASRAGDGEAWGDLYGYEMDQAAYLASLAGRDGMEDM